MQDILISLGYQTHNKVTRDDTERIQDNSGK